MKESVKKEIEKLIKEYDLNCSVGEFENRANWIDISAEHKLCLAFIREFKDRVNWNIISAFYRLPEDFIREFKDKVNWWFIIRHPERLSIPFIKEFKDIIDWSGICYYDRLSEDFIREFKDELNWKCISFHQKLSEDFIREFRDRVDWYYIFMNQKLSKPFIREFRHREVEGKRENIKNMERMYKKIKLRGENSTAEKSRSGKIIIREVREKQRKLTDMRKKNIERAKSISDVSWHEFNRMLEYKSLWNAKYFIKINRWFASSKICSECGNKKVDLKLNDRTYICENCGNILDRDFNASKNILAEGLNVLKTTQGHWESNACGDGKVHFSSVKKKKVAVKETRKILTKVIS